MEALEAINERLLANYGRGVSELPLFRVVWGGSQREMRTALYMKTTEAGLYLGEEVATRETEKYPEYLDMWILEVILPNDASFEIKAAYSYEMIWAFRDKNNNPLPYDWEVIEKICYCWLHKAAPKSQRELDHDYKESIMKETAVTLDFLKHDKVLPKRASDAPMVTVPVNYEKNNV
jgi:hypothetical protein